MRLAGCIQSSMQSQGEGMLEFSRLPLSERDPYFEEVADRRNLSKRIVEKDFWVCFALRLLFAEPELADKFVFKGGTSLSKVFGIIDRFSEDVDLSVDPDWLGFGGEKRPDAAPSRSQFEKRWKRLNAACAAAVDATVRPILEKVLQATLGPNADGLAYLVFKIDEQTQSPVLTFRYPTTEANTLGYVPPQVKLELGSLTDQRPAGQHSVTPWVAEDFPDMFSEPSCSVVALEAERTFWEKATILHKEHHRPADKPMRPRLSRDCYDLCRLAAHATGKRAIKDLALLARVVEHKRLYFHSSWSHYDTASPGSLRLAPPAHRLSELRTDYQEMQEMFTRPPQPFDELMTQLRNIENEINR